MRRNFGRCWTSRLNSSPYTDPIANVCMPIALLSTMPALLLMSGGRQKLGARSFILTTGSRNSLILPVLSLTVRLASWNCDYAQAMEVIVGF